MALAIGTITVNPDATTSGTGMAYALFLARKAPLDTFLAAQDASNSAQTRKPDPNKIAALLGSSSLALPTVNITDSASAQAALAQINAASAPFQAGPGPANYALIAQAQQSGNWPDSLLTDPVPAADRVKPYQNLAADCIAFATGIVPYLTGNAVIPATGLLDHGGGTCSGAAALT